MATTVQQKTNTENETMGENRDVRIVVRATESEKRKFDKLAKANHTDLSEIIRRLLHEAADKSNGKVAA
jgi:hypothetical protein